MARICPLAPHLINQISAGEVVERPASVLKELMENALDAGAAHITVRWRHGGQSLIEVEDNGCGIPKDEMRLALTRHATSKLSHSEDLNRIATFGFRGEALSSMASIARLTLNTYHADQAHGWSLSMHAGQEVDFQPSNRMNGTSIQVCDLFFATPARLKFMRSMTLEQNHLWDVVYKILLAHPHVAFSVHSDTRVMEYGIGIEKRLRDVFGPGFSANSFDVDQERSQYRLTGWVGLPTHHRAAPDRQFYFVNARPVKDKIFSTAFRMAFGDTMPKGRHPVGALFLTMPLSDVDVNVHPAKTEVRFLDERFVRGFLMGILKEGVWTHGLRASTWASGADSVGSSFSPAIAEQSMDSAIQEPPQSIEQIDAQNLDEHHRVHNTIGSRRAGEKIPSFTKPWFPEFRASTRPQNTYDPTIAKEDIYFSPRNQNRAHGHYAHEKIDSPNTLHLGHGATTTPIFVDLGQALIQIHDSYIVARSDAGLVLVDPHAAHERIVYEHMKTQWEHDVGLIQTFLIPLTWAMTDSECRHMIAAQAKMKNLGFDYAVSENECLLRTVPMIFQGYDPEKLVRDLITCVEDGQDAGATILAWRNHMMANWACRQSLKLGQRLTVEAMNTLLRRLERTPHGAQCNHGRCVYRILGAKELARMFDR